MRSVPKRNHRNPLRRLWHLAEWSVVGGQQGRPPIHRSGARAHLRGRGAARALATELERMAPAILKPPRRTNNEAMARKRELKGVMRQRIKEVAASRDLSDSDIAPALTLKHEQIVRFISFAAFTEISKRSGTLASRLFALLAGTETPADVAAIMSWCAASYCARRCRCCSKRRP
jgi:hypothetical protein